MFVVLGWEGVVVVAVVLLEVEDRELPLCFDAAAQSVASTRRLSDMLLHSTKDNIKQCLMVSSLHC